MKRLVIFAFVLYSQAFGQNIITTAVGSDPRFPSNITVALNAPLQALSAVATDAQGNIYVADSAYNLVFRVSPDGGIRIVAGTGIAGFSGDGGYATSATLRSPGGLAVDASGSIFIGDSGNGRIRRVSPSGIITTFAGGGADGAGDGGPATSASFTILQLNALSVAVDGSGNVFAGDYCSVRKVTAGFITTVAGNGLLGFSGDGGPATSASLSCRGIGVAVDASGNIYIRDYLRIRRVSAGIITTVAGNGTLGFTADGGPATSAAIIPSGVAVDASGNLLFADGGNQRVRKVLPDGTLTTIAGSGNQGFSGDGGPALAASLYGPSGIAVDTFGNLFIADLDNFRIRKVSASGIITSVAGVGPHNYRFAGDGGPATSAVLNSPSGVAVDAAGNLFIADILNNRIRKMSTNGAITTVAGSGSAGFSGDNGPATSASLFLGLPGVAVDASGNLFFADSGNQRVRKVSTSGIITTIAGNGNNSYSSYDDGGPAALAALYSPAGLAVDAAGSVFIADSDNNRIRKVSPSGIITTVAGGNGSPGLYDGGPATSATLENPLGVAVDASGNLFIADLFHSRIRMVSVATGIITTYAGNGNNGYSGDGGPAAFAALFFPQAVALDSSGNLFISDTGNGLIRKVSANGTITTYAGGQGAGLADDGGPATSAGFNTPYGIAVDGSGNLFIADSANNRIREVLAGQNLPVVNASGIVNGASFSSQVAAAGEIVSAFGVGLGPSPGQLTTAPGGYLETSHAGVSVTFDGTPAPLFYVGLNQINLQVPWELGAKTLTTMLVTANGQAGPARALQLQAADPAIFMANGRMAILDAAGAQIIPGNPASAGAMLSIYATGLGAVNPPASSGQLTPTGMFFNTMAAATVTVGGIDALVSFAGLAPGLVGAYQVNFSVPAGLAGGDQPLILNIGGSSTVPLPLAVR